METMSALRRKSNYALAKKSQFELQLAAILEMRGAQLEAEVKYKEIIADQDFNEDIRSIAIKRLLSFSQRPTVLH